MMEPQAPPLHWAAQRASSPSRRRLPAPQETQRSPRRRSRRFPPLLPSSRRAASSARDSTRPRLGRPPPPTAPASVPAVIPPPPATQNQPPPADLVNGKLPTTFAGACVQVGNQPAPIFAVYTGQINFQVPAVAAGNATVQVTTNCGAA